MRTPRPAPPPAYSGSQLSSRLVLLGGQLRECSRYAYTDNFGKNDVNQVVCYGKRVQLRVHVFLGIPPLMVRLGFSQPGLLLNYSLNSVPGPSLFGLNVQQRVRIVYCVVSHV